MKTVLITGATRGLGLEFARQYRSAGWHVIGTARTPETAYDLRATGAEIAMLDVADQASISALGLAMEGRAIDLLINNAGLMGDPTATALSVDVQDWNDVFAINALGPILVTRALLPSLLLAPNPIGVTLGSQAGMLSRITGAARAPYCASKAAAHAATISLGRELAGRVLYFALRPGWVRTDMTGGEGQYDADESVRAMCATIARAESRWAEMEWAGLFIDKTGRIYPYSGDFTD